MNKEYQFCGYQNYETCRQEIKQIANHVTQDEDMRYYLAINEAVCNAAKYAKAGVKEAKICIKMHVSENYIQTCIACQTKNFDAYRFRENLRRLARDKTFKNMDWGDYTHEKISGRGFWYMLSACDFIFVDENGQHVILYSILPISAEHRSRTNIGQLALRFFIDSKGVII